jgi:hypothetical protein
MKKFAIALALSAALVTSAFAATTIASKAPKDFSCVKAAVQKREAAIDNAFSTQYTALNSALVARKTALDAAWSLTDMRSIRAAVVKAHKDYATSVKAANLASRTSRKATWATFQADSKLCKTPAATALELATAQMTDLAQ